MAIFIQPKSRKGTPAKPKGKKFTLSELQNLVDGPIELINLSSKLTIVVNEEGKLRGLPVNRVATAIMQNARKCSDFIVGNALVVDSTEI